MRIFDTKTDIAFEAFYAKDYAASCSILKNAYESLLECFSTEQHSQHYMEKALTVLQELVQIPEVEMTPHIRQVIQTEIELLENPSLAFLIQSRASSVATIVGLLSDLETIFQYWEDYLGGVGNTTKPSITVSIESRGQFSFFENIYEAKGVSSTD